MALPLPEVLGLWNGSFFTAYPLTLEMLDPAFTTRDLVFLIQGIVLATGIVLLMVRQNSRNSKV